MGSRGRKLKPREIPEARCYICLRPVTARMLCKCCQNSYDRMIARDGTTWALLLWAAERARKFIRKEWRASNAELRRRVEHYKRFAP